MKKGYNGLQKNNLFINLMSKFVLFNVFFKIYFEDEGTESNF